MIKEMNLQPVFSVPMVTLLYEKHESLNSKLKDYFLSLENNGDAFKNKTPFVQRNDEVFESSFDLFSWKNELINELKEFCWASLYQVIGKVNNYDLETLKQLHIAHSSWFHVTRKGGYFGIHNHANSAWSGVYCVAAGDEVEGKPDSGKLSFVSPQMATAAYVDKSCSELTGQFGRGNLQLRLEPGQLIIFPSWLLHEVKPYLGDSERITVAFNSWFRYTGEV